MKVIFKYLFLIVFAQNLYSQDFSKIDSKSREVPQSDVKSAESLSKYLCKPAKDDLEKVRAFYIWITHNITYDLNAFLNNKLEINENSDVFLKRRKGVCQDYANLFKDLCDYADIKCYTISGYSKGFGMNSRTQFAIPDHSWNAVFVGGKWQLIDATWGSGYVNEKTKFVKSFNEKFFLQDPKELILTHLPIDPMWQLLDCPVSIDDFNQPADKLKEELRNMKRCFSYNDSIAEFDKLSKNEQDLKLAINSYKYNPKNKINIGLAYLNYGANKSKEVVGKQKELTPQELLNGMNEIMGYYRMANEYLKGVSGEKGKQLREICNQNMQNTQSNIKQLEKMIDN